jgi:hypothetical protein
MAILRTTRHGVVLRRDEPGKVSAKTMTERMMLCLRAARRAADDAHAGLATLDEALETPQDGAVIVDEKDADEIVARHATAAIVVTWLYAFDDSKRGPVRLRQCRP